jgi:hypothetical protein
MKTTGKTQQYLLAFDLRDMTRKASVWLFAYRHVMRRFGQPLINVLNYSLDSTNDYLTAASTALSVMNIHGFYRAKTLIFYEMKR